MEASLAGILELLEKKRTLLLEFEREGAQLCTLPAGELAACLARRDALLTQAGELDGEIRRLCSGDAQALDALNHRADRADLPPAYRALFDASLAVKAVAHRILDNEAPQRGRLERERARALQRIEELNASAARVAGKYRRPAGGDPFGGGGKQF